MNKKVEKMEFEESLDELEKIISVLGEGSLSLKNASDLYIKGVRLRDHCREILEKIELKLSQISPNGNGTVSIIEKENGEVEL